MARPKTDHTKITLRMPPELHAEIKAKASAEGRSLNSQIVQTLRSSLAPRLDSELHRQA